MGFGLSPQSKNRRRGSEGNVRGQALEGPVSRAKESGQPLKELRGESCDQIWVYVRGEEANTTHLCFFICSVSHK